MRRLRAKVAVAYDRACAWIERFNYPIWMLTQAAVGAYCSTAATSAAGRWAGFAGTVYCLLRVAMTAWTASVHGESNGEFRW